MISYLCNLCELMLAVYHTQYSEPRKTRGITCHMFTLVIISFVMTIITVAVVIIVIMFMTFWHNNSCSNQQQLNF